MSCTNCARSFSLLNREKACAKCGFAFCSKCLLSNNGSKVCAACHKKAESGSAPRPRSPPTALERRLEQLATVPPQPITVYSKESEKMTRLKRGLSQEDKGIAERLQRLQSDRKKMENLPSDSEMAVRLAALKGLPTVSDIARSANAGHCHGGTNNFHAGFYHAPESRVPDPQRADQLMDRMAEEVSLDGRARASGAAGGVVDPAKDIAERLAKLRGLSVEEDEARRQKDRDEIMAGAERMEDLPSDEEADDLVEKLLAEQKLEEKLGELPSPDDENDNGTTNRDRMGMRPILRHAQRSMADDDDEELPWCSICNEDATLRCRDCDGDLFCARCYRECHGEFEMDHRAEKYTKPASKKK